MKGLPRGSKVPSLSIWTITLLLLFLSASSAFGRIPFRILPCILKQVDNVAYPEGECVVHYVPGISEQERMRVHIQYGLLPVYQSPYGNFEKVLIPVNFPVVSMVSLLKGDPSVLHAEPNYLAEAHLIPNDPLFRYQWNMLQIKADLAWNTTSGTGVTIAVLDSGAAYEYFDIYAEAPDLSGTIFVPGWDFVNNDANPDDDYGHGTHITGTVAQTTNNFLGCTGVAFGASIMPVKVLDNTGNGSLTNVVDGIYFAANNGAKIINMSFGFGNNPSLTLQNAVNYANAAGCLLVCSAGNGGTNLPNYPSSYTPCISVSSTIYDQTLASYSNYGVDIDLCAPGGDLTLDQNLDGYPDGILQQSHDGVDFTVFDYFAGKGTSWSAAHVTGVAAMVTSAGGTAMTPLEIRNILESTALDLGVPAWDELFGWGLIDATAALAAVQSGATVLSASPLQPIFVNPLTLPIATVAGDIIPFAPLREGQSGYNILGSVRYMSSGSNYLQKPWPGPMISPQSPLPWGSSNTPFFPYFPRYLSFMNPGALFYAYPPNPTGYFWGAGPPIYGPFFNRIPNFIP